jgi:hypothetical protein
VNFDICPSFFDISSSYRENGILPQKKKKYKIKIKNCGGGGLLFDQKHQKYLFELLFNSVSRIYR